VKGSPDPQQPGLPFGSPSRAAQVLTIGRSAYVLRLVRNRRARHYVLRVGPDGSLCVTVPPFGSVAEARRFVHAQAGWLARERARILARAPREASEVARLRTAAAAALPCRLRALAAAHGLRVARVTIRNQHTRWGSCSRSGSVSLNWRLVLMPDPVRDYVLIHELMHLRHANHSRRFWRAVEEACPWYREARRWLRKHGDTLR
jgi:predicted metal-dependent hydrolase